ncbi:MAG: hypothetical protein ABUT39_08960 [Acidobacteriota bacterium]
MQVTVTRKSRRMEVLAAFLVLLFLAIGCSGPQVQGLAAVKADGTLLRGVKVASVAKQPPGYRVEFDPSVDVANGYYLVTPGLTGSCNTMINAEKTTGNAVYVSFADRGPGINFVDCNFSLAVY